MVARFAATLATALALVSPAFAQEDAGALALELNALQPVEGGCRVTFLATNGLGGALGKAAFEVALFTADGTIDRLVSLDFKALAKGKTKVLQFELKALDCAGVSRVLINDVTACEGDGIAAGACLDQLTTSTRTKAQFGV